MERLACLPLERFQTAREPFTRALSAKDAATRLWAAIALVRLGNVKPLKQAFDDLLRGRPRDAAPAVLGRPLDDLRCTGGRTPASAFSLIRAAQIEASAEP